MLMVFEHSRTHGSAPGDDRSFAGGDLSWILYQTVIDVQRGLALWRQRLKRCQGCLQPQKPCYRLPHLRDRNMDDVCSGKMYHHEAHVLMWVHVTDPACGVP